MKSNTVLVVDDDTDVLSLVSDILEIDDYNVLKAGSGEAAVEALTLQPVDLIVLDIMLPGISGLEVLDYLRTKMGIQAPVILLSAMANPEMEKEGRALGAEEYVSKPFDPFDLSYMVKSLIENTTKG